MQLLTLKEIARRLNIPESTARFYRDKFPEYIPSEGIGRNKRYLPEAEEVLRFIAEGLRNGRSATDIEGELRLKYQAITDIEPIEAQLPQQYSSSAELTEAIRELVDQNNQLIELLARPWWKRLLGRK